MKRRGSTAVVGLVACRDERSTRRGILRRNDVQYAVVGGIAVIARGYLRDTRDFEFDDPIRGVIRIAFSPIDKVDVVVAKSRWEQDIIARSEPIDVGGFVAPVPTIPDLIRLKLFAGGGIDRNDILATLRAE